MRTSTTSSEIEIGSTHHASTTACNGHAGGRRWDPLLVHHSSGQDRGELACTALARSRQRQGHVSRRRLRVLSRSEPGGQNEARRRGGTENSVRHVLLAQYFSRSEGWDRRVERSGFLDRHVEGELARGQALLSR